MITPELPPLPNPPLEYRHEGCTYIDRESFLEWHDQHSARQRILLARVAELEAELLAAADVLDNCRYSEQPAAKRARDAAMGGELCTAKTS